MTRPAAEVEAEVEAQRGQLDSTVEALKGKMNPSEIFDETASALGDVGQQMLSKFVQQARENPMPVALIGLGLVWMMAGSGSKRDGRAFSRGSGYAGSYGDDGYGQHYGSDAERSGLRDKLSGVAGTMSDRAHDFAASTGDAAHHAANKAQSLVSGAKDKLSDAKDKLSDVAGQARQGVRSAGESLKARSQSMAGAIGDSRDRISETVGGYIDREPLLLAGLGLAVGFAVGSALPSTPLEDQALGHTRDQLLEKGKDLVGDTLDQAGDLAKSAYGAAKQELTPEQDRETV